MSQNPISAPASFYSLPIELALLVFIRLSPTRERANTLSRVSKRFQAIAELYIWRQVTISILHAPGEGLSKPEKMEAVARWLSKKLKGMMNAANERRWAMVRKAEIEPTWGALHATIQILENISATLETLILRTPRSQAHPEWIDTRLSTCGILLSFPKLKNVRIQRRAIHFVEFLIVLCNYAPNVEVLDVEICASYEQPPASSESDDLTSFRFPYRFTRNTLIRKLRIFYEETIRRGGQKPDPFDIVIDLIRHSPAIQSLSLIFDSCADFPVHQLGPIVARLACLADLNWPVMELGALEGDGDIVLYASLRRLALGHSGQIIPTIVSPPLPALKTLVMDYSRCGLEDGLSSEISHQIDIPAFASWITPHPRLRQVHFLCKETDEDHKTHVNFGLLQRCGRPTGIIRSLSHLGETITQISLKSWLDPDQPASDKLSLVMADNESDRLAIPAHQHVWKIFTVVQDETVPNWVWDKMREAAGASKKDWDARGVEVDEATWMVLQDWLDAPDRPSEEE